MVGHRPSVLHTVQRAVKQVVEHHACLGRCDGFLAANLTHAGDGRVAADQSVCGCGADIRLSPCRKSAVVRKIGLFCRHNGQVCRGGCHSDELTACYRSAGMEKRTAADGFSGHYAFLRQIDRRVMCRITVHVRVGESGLILFDFNRDSGRLRCIALGVHGGIVEAVASGFAARCVI